jgi:hypothetical protein
MHEAAQAAFVLEPHDAGNLGEQGVVLAPADVIPRLQPRAALANQDGAARDELAVKALHTQPLGVGIAAVS